MNEVTQQQKVSPLVVFKKDLQRLHDAGELALPKTVPFENFRNALVVAITDSPGILNCNRESIFKAVRTLAGAGLVPDGREAAIVPFKGEAQAMPMVAGLIKVARNSGQIKSLWSEVVYEGEEFKIWVENGERKFSHDYDAMNRSGKITGAYAVAKLSDGTIDLEPMGFDEIEKRRKASANQRNPQPTGIWEKWYGEMARKTVIRALCKRLPMSSDDMNRILQEQEPMLRDVTPEDEPKKPNLAQRLQQAEPEPDAPEQPLDGEILPPEDEAAHWTASVSLDQAFPGDPEWNEGMTARSEGKPITDCPYEGDLEKAASWIGGWQERES